jgi:hypothetical protein
MDDAPLTAAHPDDTLFLVGPPRYDSSDDFLNKLLPLGKVMNWQRSGAIPLQPAQAMGSGRGFYTRGKGSWSWSMGRILMQGRNLLRALSTNAVRAGLNIQDFNDPATAEARDEQYITNIDSELFYIPFGIAVLQRNKMQESVGSYYMELCMLSGFSDGVGSGQSMIMENVQGLSERSLAIYPRRALMLARAAAGQPTLSSIRSNVLGIGLTDNDVTPNLFGANAR